MGRFLAGWGFAFVSGVLLCLFFEESIKNAENKHNLLLFF